MQNVFRKTVFFRYQAKIRRAIILKAEKKRFVLQSDSTPCYQLMKKDNVFSKLVAQYLFLWCFRKVIPYIKHYMVLKIYLELTLLYITK